MVGAFLRRFEDGRSTALQLSYTRVALGSAFLLAPRLLWRPQMKQPADLEQLVLPLRMAGIRDLSLGLGAVFALRRGAPVRGWLEAAALADAADALLFSRAKTLRPLPRWASAASAATAVVLGSRAARQLS